MIFETHAHYDDEAFDEDREKLLETMHAHGIEKIINVGASLQGVRDTVALTEKYPFVYGAVGIHPDEVGNLTEEDMKELRSYCDREKIAAIGEIGLDYYWDKENHEIQKKWFVRQMDLAKETGLPIIVHSRDAAKDTLDIMKAERADHLRGVIHCYSYSKEHAREYMNRICTSGLSAFGDGCPLSGSGTLQREKELFPVSYLCCPDHCADKGSVL